MKKYEQPILEALEINQDVLTTSGTETTAVENTDGVWDLNQNV